MPIKMTAVEQREILIEECVRTSLYQIDPVAVNQVIFRLFQVWGQTARMLEEAKYKAIAHELAATEPNDRLLLLKFNECVLNCVWMEVDNLYSPIDLRNNDLNYKASLPENSDATTIGFFFGSADFSCFDKILTEPKSMNLAIATIS
jgi:hypothetical protein